MYVHHTHTHTHAHACKHARMHAHTHTNTHTHTHTHITHTQTYTSHAQTTHDPPIVLGVTYPIGPFNITSIRLLCSVAFATVAKIFSVAKRILNTLATSTLPTKQQQHHNHPKTARTTRSISPFKSSPKVVKS